MTSESATIQSPPFVFCEGKVLNEYKLTFTVIIKEQDDPAARKQAKRIIEAVGGVLEGTEVKLQQLHHDKPPRGIKIA